MKPPRQNQQKEKKSTNIDGLLRIVNDHGEQLNIHSKPEKQSKETNENVSYFRVAKSRYGKFETDSRGFVTNSIAIFDSTNQQKLDQQMSKTNHSSETSNNSKQSKSIPNIINYHTKGKQAYNLLKKYEKEEQLKSKTTYNGDCLNVKIEQEKPSPLVQLEPTEQINPVSVTVESVRKHFMTTGAPVPPPPAPPILAPKPFGKTVTEYRTVRRMGNPDETTSTSTTDTNIKRSTANDINKRLSSTSIASHEALMESIRQFGGSKNLRRG